MAGPDPAIHATQSYAVPVPMDTRHRACPRAARSADPWAGHDDQGDARARRALGFYSLPCYLVAVAVPFDTLKLARRLEAAGFPAQQAGDMSEAIAEAVSQLATKADIEALKADIELLKRDLTIRFGGMMVAAVGIILAGVAALLRLPH
jgi:hypothetical protein